MHKLALITFCSMAFAISSPIASAQVTVTGQARSAGPIIAPKAKFEPQGDSVYHGAGLPDFWSESGLRTQVNTYAQAAGGKRTSVITWFASTYEKGVLTNWRQNYAHNLTRVKRMGAASLIKFSTQDYAFPSTKKQADLKLIALGSWDGYFREMATVLKDYKSPVFLSINHEMNGNWYPYSQEYPGSNVTTQDFVNSWRRIVTIFRNAGANNVAFVWSPNVPDVGRATYQQYYPGDEYVDWIGVSFYSGNATGAMDPIYRAYAEKKPFFITEWATAPQKNVYNARFPGEVEWVKQFFAALETRYPRVKAISWFNWDKDDGDYRLQRVPQQAETYAQDVAAPRYIGQDKGLVGTNWNVETDTIERPGNEIIFREVAKREPNKAVAPPIVTPKVVTPPVVTPPVVNPPTRRSLKDLIKIEVMKTETVKTSP
jgi:hypothetical protein